MTREIKLRAWGKRDKVMQDVGSLSWLNGGIKAYGQGSHVENDDYFVDGDNVILLEYTGLHDKNGVEICEGDVISYIGYSAYGMDDKKSQFAVKWNNLDGGFSLGWLFEKDNGDIALQNKEIEIIGDIYSNPELLTK